MTLNINKSDQWLAVSCLQNAIRRGHTQLAVDYTKALLKINPFYAQYRLSVIAVEDIGVADIETITPFLNTELKKANVQDMGGENFILEVASQLSQSKKDRTACDLGGLARKTTFPETINHLNGEEIKTFVLDNESTIEQKALGLWLLADAKRLKHPIYPNIENGIEHFIDIHRQWQIPESFIKTMIACKNYSSEPIWPHLGLCYLHKRKYLEQEKLEQCKVIKKQFEIFLVDDKWLIEGLDKHTQEGKAAISKFIFRNKEINNILNKNQIPDEDKNKLVGNSLFRLDGQAVDKRINYPLAVKVYKKAIDINYGQAKKELMSFFHKNWNIWNEHLIQTYQELYNKKKYQP